MNQEELQTKERILKASFSLFLKNGYDRTPVQAIIDEVGIAKGTFYHHFASKEEMLVDLVESLSRRVMDVIAPLVEAPGLDARQKFLAVCRAATTQKTGDMGPETVVLVRQMRQKANRLLADSIDEISSQWVLPCFVTIVRQGCGEGVFHVAEPDLAAELVLGAIMGTKNRVIDLFLTMADGDPTAIARLRALYGAVEQAVERILGTAEGSLPLYAAVDLELIRKRILPGGTQ